MSEFSRTIDLKIIEKLRDEELFTKHLLPDIIDGKVFPAIRGGYVSFYYKGGSLFTYDGAFKTHIKYAFVPQGNENGYVGENSLADMKQQVAFRAAYEQIKARCAQYAGLEAAGVSELHKFSFAAYPAEWYYLLDTEIALDASMRQDEAADEALALSEEDKAQEIDTFSSPELEEQPAPPTKKRATDRIDLLLMNAKTGRLLFCEAKLFSNKELTSTAKGKNVVDQLERYRGQIADKRDAIIAQYGAYARAMEALTGINIDTSTGLCDGCGLLIFGFDQDQKGGKKLETIKKWVTDKGFPVYAIGNIKGIDPETLFTQLAKGV